jgi:hypothetical protein
MKPTFGGRCFGRFWVLGFSRDFSGESLLMRTFGGMESLDLNIPERRFPALHAWIRERRRA